MLWARVKNGIRGRIKRMKADFGAIYFLCSLKLNKILSQKSK